MSRLNEDVDDVNIQHIKLITGDELIAIVLDHDDYKLLKVQRPMKLELTQYESGLGFVFYEWQPLSSTDFCFINPIHIVSHVECANDVKIQYINACVNDSSDPDPMDGEPTDINNTDKPKYYH